MSANLCRVDGFGSRVECQESGSPTSPTIEAEVHQADPPKHYHASVVVHVTHTCSSCSAPYPSENPKILNT